jgi:hypothetical protein
MNGDSDIRLHPVFRGIRGTIVWELSMTTSRRHDSLEVYGIAAGAGLSIPNTACRSTRGFCNSSRCNEKRDCTTIGQRPW